MAQDECDLPRFKHIILGFVFPLEVKHWKFYATAWGNSHTALPKRETGFT